MKVLKLSTIFRLLYPMKEGTEELQNSFKAQIQHKKDTLCFTKLKLKVSLQRHALLSSLSALFMTFVTAIGMRTQFLCTTARSKIRDSSSRECPCRHSQTHTRLFPYQSVRIQQRWHLQWITISRAGQRGCWITFGFFVQISKSLTQTNYQFYACRPIWHTYIKEKKERTKYSSDIFYFAKLAGISFHLTNSLWFLVCLKNIQFSNVKYKQAIVLLKHTVVWNVFAPSLISCFFGCLSHLCFRTSNKLKYYIKIAQVNSF